MKKLLLFSMLLLCFLATEFTGIITELYAATPVAGSLTVTPNPTSGASSVTVNAIVSMSSAGKIADFENVKFYEKVINDTKDGSFGKPAKISTVEVSNSYVKASVADNGEIIITTASGIYLLYASGYTGKTYVRLDGVSYRFGGSDGVWTTALYTTSNQVKGVWKLGDIEITETITIVQSTTTGNYDTFMMEYSLKNAGTTSHDVGFYKMFDTMINYNDYAPVSAGDGYNLNEREFTGTSVPNFWQAYEESPTQASTKVIAQGTLYGGGAVKPDRFVIGDWSRLNSVTWDYRPTGSYGDSGVSLWWDPTTLSSGSSRTVATLYGLGSVQTTVGQISLTLSGESTLGIVSEHLNPNPFQVTAIVTNSSGLTANNVQANISLPSGLTLASGETATQTIGTLSNGSSGQVTWSVVATEKTTDATYTYTVTASSTTSGISSVTGNRNVYVPGIVSSIYVAAAEVYIDTDPGQGLATVMSSSDGAFDEASEDVTKSVSVTGLSVGEHLVYVRGKDSGGTWGTAVSTTFIVNNPLVTYPSVSGISWIPGSSYNITWSGFAGTTVNIYLYKGSTLVETIATSTTNDGTQSYSVPTTLTSGSDYKIRITGTNSQSDYSDNYFTIGGLTITAATVAGTNGGIVSVPITVTSGEQLYSSQIGVSFSSADLDLTTITTASGVTTEWKRSTTLTTVQITALKSAGFGSTQTTICTMKFYVKKGAGSSTINLMTTSKFYKDDGTLLTAALVNGGVTIGSGSTIAGARGDVNNDSSVDVRDALYVLRMAVLSSITISGTSYTSPYNAALKYRADVNGNASVQSSDATLILRKVLGINTNLYPLSSAGKITGDIPTLQLISGETAGSEIKFSLSGSSLDGIASGDFAIRFDTDALDFVSLESSPLLNDTNFEYNVSEPGILRIAMAQAAGMENAPTELLSLCFSVKNSAALTSDAITIEEAYLWDENTMEIESTVHNTRIDKGSIIAHAFVLYQNAPNPFNPTTTIEFTMERESRVTVKIYNIAGQEVATLKNEIIPAGRHSLIWNAADMPSGMYFYKVSAGNYSETKKMMLLK